MEKQESKSKKRKYKPKPKKETVTFDEFFIQAVFQGLARPEQYNELNEFRKHKNLKADETEDKYKKLLEEY